MCPALHRMQTNEGPTRGLCSPYPVAGSFSAMTSSCVATTMLFIHTAEECGACYPTSLVGCQNGTAFTTSPEVVAAAWLASSPPEACPETQDNHCSTAAPSFHSHGNPAWPRAKALCREDYRDTRPNLPWSRQAGWAQDAQHSSTAQHTVERRRGLRG